MNWIWVFNGMNAAIPSGIFTDKEKAEKWIAENQLTGMLTRFPVDEGLFDWAVREGCFTPKRDDQKSPRFKQAFTCASLEHYHYEDGSDNI